MHTQLEQAVGQRMWTHTAQLAKAVRPFVCQPATHTSQAVHLHTQSTVHAVQFLPPPGRQEPKIGDHSKL